jgi:hypothetical protein
MSVLSLLKSGFARRGVRKFFAKVPAKVILVSWPSFARNTWLRDRGRVYKQKKKKLTHVRSNEHPLRKHPVSKVLIKQSKILDVVTTCNIARHRIVNNQRAKDVVV